MTRPQRRIHLLAWLILAAAIALTIRSALATRTATWGALDAAAPTGTPRAQSTAP